MDRREPSVVTRRREAGAGLAVLTYHGFHSRRSVLTTEPGWFVETLDRLDAAGFHAVDLASWIERGRPDEPLGYALTFDDGLASLELVAEAVAARRIPAVVFAVAGRVGSTSAWPGASASGRVERLLDWSELAHLGRLGFRIEAHGTSHRPLDSCSEPELEDELRGAREMIEDRLGGACRLLAYPYGRSRGLTRRLAARSFAASFGTGLGYAGRGQTRRNLDRLDAYYLSTPQSLDALIADRWRPWLRRRRWLRAARVGLNRIGDALASFPSRRAA